MPKKLLRTPLNFTLTSDTSHIVSKALIVEITTVEDLKIFHLSKSFTTRISEAIKAKNARHSFFKTPVDMGAVQDLIIAFQGSTPDEEYIPALSGEIRSAPSDSLALLASPQRALDRLDLLVLARYQFSSFLSKPKNTSSEIVVIKPSKELTAVIKHRLEDLNAVYLARDLINYPPSDKAPSQFADFIDELDFKTTKVKILRKKDLEKLGCNLLLAVGAGSDNSPVMVTFERITDKKLPTVALVGKGITFDAGGLQIKPGKSMLDMKSDMSGAAAVVGAFHRFESIDTLPVNVVGVIAVAENLLGPNAFKPLDIIRGYNGTTVENHHTDAEGRLVLADAVAYSEDMFSPEAIVTIATLTGAQISALGYNYSSIISRDDEMVTRIQDAADRAHEAYWPLPLDKHLENSLKAKIADMKNIADSVGAGSSVGAAFIGAFIKKSSFTHLDIAGPSFLSSPHEYRPAGGTGYGTLTFIEMILRGTWNTKKPSKK